MTPPSTEVAPYLSFATFRAAIQNLRAHGLPGKLDRSAWGSRSGTEQGQIWGALRFLSLIDKDGNTLPALTNLVAIAEDSPEEKSQISELIRLGYQKVFALDLTTATPKQLDDAMGEYGVGGATKKRAVRFFIKAASFTGTRLSSRLTANLRDRSSANEREPAELQNGGEAANANARSSQQITRRRAPRRTQQAMATTAGVPPVSANAMKTIQLPRVGGSLSITGTFNAFQLMGDERELVYRIIDLMNEYEQKAT